MYQKLKTRPLLCLSIWNALIIILLYYGLLSYFEHIVQIIDQAWEYEKTIEQIQLDYKELYNIISKAKWPRFKKKSVIEAILEELDLLENLKYYYKNDNFFGLKTFVKIYKFIKNFFNE